MGQQDIKALISEQHIDAVKVAYSGNIDARSFPAKFPALSHRKRQIFAAAESLRSGLEDKALHREACKVLKQPVPDRCFTDTELRAALVSYYFKVQVKVSIPSITAAYGPSKVTLWRLSQRLHTALHTVGWRVPFKAMPMRDDVRAVAAAIDFPLGGATALFLPGEERLLLEMAAKHAVLGS
jgi:hypothetical protein